MDKCLHWCRDAWIPGGTDESQLLGDLKCAATQSPRPGLLADSPGRPRLYLCPQTLPLWWVTLFLKTTRFFPQRGCPEGPQAWECQNCAHTQDDRQPLITAAPLMCFLWVRAPAASMLFLFQQRSDIFKRKKSEVAGSVFGLKLQTVLWFDYSLIWL